MVYQDMAAKKTQEAKVLVYQTCQASI